MKIKIAHAQTLKSNENENLFTYDSKVTCGRWVFEDYHVQCQEAGLFGPPQFQTTH